MAEAVVQKLEAVQVEHQHREAPPAAPVAGDLVVDPREQRPAVGRAGQRVTQGGSPKRVALALQALAHREQNRHAGRRHEHEQGQGGLGRATRGGGPLGDDRRSDYERAAEQAGDAPAGRPGGQQRGRNRHPDRLAPGGQGHRRRGDGRDCDAQHGRASRGEHGRAPLGAVGLRLPPEAWMIVRVTHRAEVLRAGRTPDGVAATRPDSLI
jgi:hypothetical protein